MNRHQLLQAGMARAFGVPLLLAALKLDRLEDAVAVLARATEKRLVAEAVLHVAQGKTTFTRHFHTVSHDAMFLLGSISEPVCMTAVMTLFDRGALRLDDPVRTGVAH